MTQNDFHLRSLEVYCLRNLPDDRPANSWFDGN